MFSFQSLSLNSNHHHKCLEWMTSRDAFWAKKNNTINHFYLITLMNTKFWDSVEGFFSGLFFKCWSQKLKSFYFFTSGFSYKLNWNFYHCYQNSIASDGIKVENSQNYEHNMELKHVFFCEFIPIVDYLNLFLVIGYVLNHPFSKYAYKTVPKLYKSRLRKGP